MHEAANVMSHVFLVCGRLGDLQPQPLQKSFMILCFGMSCTTKGQAAAMQAESLTFMHKQTLGSCPVVST